MEHLWETFDALWKTLHKQSRRVEELESQVKSYDAHRSSERSRCT